jgi:hypothetical protein
LQNNLKITLISEENAIFLGKFEYTDYFLKEGFGILEEDFYLKTEDEQLV